MYQFFSTLKYPSEDDQPFKTFSSLLIFFNFYYVAEGFTPMILQIKGNSLPGKNEIEEKIGHYNNNDMHVTSVESGSIIIRLQMFSSAFQSLGYVLIAIDKLLQQAFSARPISEDNIVVCIILSMDTHQLSEGLY